MTPFNRTFALSLVHAWQTGDTLAREALRDYPARMHAKLEDTEEHAVFYKVEEDISFSHRYSITSRWGWGKSPKYLSVYVDAWQELGVVKPNTGYWHARDGTIWTFSVTLERE